MENEELSRLVAQTAPAIERARDDGRFSDLGVLSAWHAVGLRALDDRAAPAPAPAPAAAPAPAPEKPAKGNGAGKPRCKHVFSGPRKGDPCTKSGCKVLRSYDDREALEKLPLPGQTSVVPTTHAKDFAGKPQCGAGLGPRDRATADRDLVDCPACTSGAAS